MILGGGGANVRSWEEGEEQKGLIREKGWVEGGGRGGGSREGER